MQQWCYQSSDVTKGNEIIQSNLQKPQLHKDTAPLNKLLWCEEQLTEIHKKYPDKYIIFTNNKQVLSDHLFPKGACLIVGDSMLTGINKNRLKSGKHKSGKHKAKVRYFPGAPTDDMFDYMKPLLRKLLDYIILHWTKNEVFHYKFHQ